MCGLVTDARNQQSVERVVEQTSLILLTTVQAKCLHADDACDGGLHAQTDRDASLLISQIVSPLPKYGFCVLLKSLHCSQYLIVQSQERRGTVSWALTRTDCGNEKSFGYKQTAPRRTRDIQYSVPFWWLGLICIMPDYQNNPPLIPPTVAPA